MTSAAPPDASRRQQPLFERVGNALGGVLADSQAYGGVPTGDKGVPFGPGATDVRLRAGYAEGFFGPGRGKFGERAVRLAAVAAAFEEVVSILPANRQQAQLGEAGIGIDHHRIRRGQQRLERGPDRQPLAQAAPLVGDVRVAEARVAGEQIVILSRPHKDDLGLWEALLGRGQQHAGHGYVRAQGDAREHEHAVRLEGNGARPAYTLVPGHQQSGVHIIGHMGHGLREQPRVDVAEPRLEAIGQTLGQDSEQGLPAGIFDKRRRQFRRRPAGEALVQKFARDLVTRSTCQSGSPASGAWPPEPVGGP